MARQLKAAMWIKSPSGKVGILFSNTVTGKMEFHEVGKDGTTVLAVPLDGVPETLGYIQASNNDIPECRRMSPELARQLGYLPLAQ